MDAVDIGRHVGVSLQLVPVLIHTQATVEMTPGVLWKMQLDAFFRTHLTPSF